MAPPVPEPTDKRPYLAREDRRTALLDVAASIVEERGWAALSMISLADAAKVSRQLVYQHFPSVNDLLAETMTHLFRHQYEAIRAHVANPDLSVDDLIAVTERITFDEPPQRVRALWQMLAAAEGGNPEAARVSTKVRHLLVKLWTPTTMRYSQLPEPQARTLAWMLNMAFWGAHQMVDEQEISREDATRLCQQLIRAIQQHDPAAR